MMISTPFDINEAHALGVDSFVRGFQLLVSQPEFDALESAVYGLFTSTSSIPDKDIMDAIIIDYRFLFFLLQLIHFETCISRLGRHWEGDRMSDEVVGYFYPDWDKKASKSAIFGDSRNKISRVKGALRNFRNTAQENKGSVLNSLYRQWRRDHEIVVLGPLHALGATKNTNEGLHLCTDVFPEDLLGANYDDLTFSKRALEQFVAPLESRVKETLYHLGVNLRESEVFTTLLRRLEVVNRHALGFSSSFSLTSFRNAKRLRAVGNGNPLRKLVEIVAHRKGITVELVNHGFDLAHIPSMNAVRGRYAGATEFILQNRVFASEYTKLYSDDPAISSLPLKFLSAKTVVADDDLESPILRDHSVARFDVMIMGFPMNWFRYLSTPGSYWYIQLNLQYRLAQTLHDRGFSVVYKCHPDRKGPWLDMFRSVVDHIDGGNISVSTAQYDVATYLFTGTISTSFGFLAKTGRRLVLVEHPDVEYTELGLELVNSRCSIVPTSLDKRGQVDFCDETLFSAMRDPPKESSLFRELL